MTAFGLPLGDGRFAPTRATESPWDSGMQHGSPPAAGSPPPVVTQPLLVRERR